MRPRHEPWGFSFILFFCFVFSTFFFFLFFVYFSSSSSSFLLLLVLLFIFFSSSSSFILFFVNFIFLRDDKFDLMNFSQFYSIPLKVSLDMNKYKVIYASNVTYENQNIYIFPLIFLYYLQNNLPDRTVIFYTYIYCVVLSRNTYVTSYRLFDFVRFFLKPRI